LVYDAYGSQPEEQLAHGPLFSWKQQFTDPTNQLVYLRSRFYHPGLMRFMSMDSYPVPNRYAFGNGNPIDRADPSGNMSEGAAMGIGIGVGILATLVTGGALGVVIGTDILASMAVGAVAGAVGQLAGEATTAGLNGESLSGEQIGISFASGFAGGLVGAGVGSIVGRKAMSVALERALSRGAITAVGAASSGLTGGAAGAVASSAVTSGAYGEPFFSSDFALNVVVGSVAGMAGGVLGSAAHIGMLPTLGGSTLRVTPVAASRGAAFHVRGDRVANMISPAAEARFGIRRMEATILDFTPSDNDHGTIMSSQRRLTNHFEFDAVVVHGFLRHVFPETLRGTSVHMQYMRPEDFAAMLITNHQFGGRGGKDIRLWSCYAAGLRTASVAQRMAKVLQVNVYAPASRGSITLDYAGAWIRYSP
jgi:RHS repeat-associated protein